MRSILFSLTALMAGTHQAMAFTYWIDGTCSGDKSLDEIIKETKYMAEAAHRRLNSGSDTDFQHVYEFAMKTTKDTNSAGFKSMSNFMKDVSEMTQTNDRNSANVRFYCDDNETRWEERKDPATGRNTGGWEDKANWMLYGTHIRPGCLFTKNGFKAAYAETFVDYMEGDAPEKQQDPRATISICDRFFFEAGRPYIRKLFAGIKPESDLSKDPINLDTFVTQKSKLLLHELSHTNPYATKDHRQTYGWSANPFGGTAVTDLSADDLSTHADVRGIIGQLALLAERGYTLHRKPKDDALQKEKDDYNNDMKKGKLHKYENVSKRKRGLERRIPRRERRKTGN